VAAMDELRAAVIEAREELRGETAAGIIEGAAIALGLTALELLDEIDAK
jgi:hypothetical protein